MSPQPHPDAWTQAEDALLRELWPSRLKLSEIAKRIGRSHHACKRRAYVLHITGTRPRGAPDGSAAPKPKADRSAANSKQPWSPDDDRELLRLLRSGMPMQEVAPLLNRSESSIDNRARMLGMARRTLPGGAQQWYEPTVAMEHRRMIPRGPTASEAAWNDRQPPRYGKQELVTLWLEAMARISNPDQRRLT